MAVGRAQQRHRSPAWAWLVLASLLSGCAAPGIGPGETPAVGGTGGPPGSRDGGGQGGSGCSGSGPVTFTHSPMRFEDFVMLQPYGLMIGGHVTPIDHMYFAPARDSVRDQFEVRAIADGQILDIGTRPSGPNGDLVEYRIWFDHTCTFHSYFDLVTKLAPDIQAVYDAAKHADGYSGYIHHPVTAGQLIGYIGAQTLDFGVYDDTVTLPGFIVPEHYEDESWKIHTVDPFPHFQEPLRTQLLDRMVRQAEPRAGKIDHDVDGRLVGNWFLQGTDGYGDGGRSRTYWSSHLAFAPDALTPDRFRVSLGDWQGEARQFGAKGNAPDPVSVSVASGLVKYELSQALYTSGGTYWDGWSLVDDLGWENDGRVVGTVAVQLLEDRVLKVETFPGKTAGQVVGFTAATRLYER